MDTVFHSEGVLVDYRPVAAAKAGEIVFHGTMCGQVVADIEAGMLGARRTEGVISVTKALTDVFDPLAAVDVHWNSTTKTASLVAANGLMGRAVGGGANGQSYVLVKLNH